MKRAELKRVGLNILSCFLFGVGILVALGGVVCMVATSHKNAPPYNEELYLPDKYPPGGPPDPWTYLVAVGGVVMGVVGFVGIYRLNPSEQAGWEVK